MLLITSLVSIQSNFGRSSAHIRLFVVDLSFDRVADFESLAWVLTFSFFFLLRIVSHRLRISSVLYIERFCDQCFMVWGSRWSFGARALQYGVSLKCPPLSHPQWYLRPFRVTNVWKWYESSIYITKTDSPWVILPWEAFFLILWAIKGVWLQILPLFAVVPGLCSWPWRRIICGGLVALFIFYASGIYSFEAMLPFEVFSGIDRR
jgi:hypothetical protein